MKKRILLLMVFVAGLIGSVQAQEETLFGNNALDLTGIWYNNRQNFSFFPDDAHHVRGGSIDLEFGRSIYLGWAWHRMRDDLFLEDGNINFKLRHNGLKLAYAPAAGRVVHPYFSIMAGSGRLEISGDGDDRIFGVTPAGGLEVNVLDWFRLGAEAGYRFVTDVDVRNLGSEDFSTPFVQVMLRFGFSWGYW